MDPSRLCYLSSLHHFWRSDGMWRHSCGYIWCEHLFLGTIKQWLLKQASNIVIDCYWKKNILISDTIKMCPHYLAQFWGIQSRDKQGSFLQPLQCCLIDTQKFLLNLNTVCLRLSIHVRNKKKMHNQNIVSIIEIKMKSPQRTHFTQRSLCFNSD